MKKLFILFLVSLFVLRLSAQTSQDCPLYDVHLAEADALKAKQHYEDALLAYQQASAAALECGLTSSETEQRIRALVAEMAKHLKTSPRLGRYREMKHSLDSMTKILAQKDTIIAHKNDIINNIYFYKDSLGLSYYMGRYGFIDKDGNVLINHEYNYALPFEYETGFAKVKKMVGYTLTDYLITPQGKEYKVAYKLEDLKPDITAVDLRGGKFKGLPDTLLNFPNLRVIILNGIQDYPYRNPRLLDGIDRLVNLEYLKLRDCGIKRIYDNLYSLSDLVDLDLTYNSLDYLPRGLNKLNKLEYLNLSNSKYENIPEGIGDLTNLKVLDLSFNHIDSIPESIGGLVQLKYLDLSHNKIKSLPKSTSNLKQLTRLFLDYNRFIDYPEIVNTLYKLEYLSALHSNITTMPKSIGNLTQLKKLDLDFNQIRTIPKEISRLVDLEILGLTENENLSPSYIRLVKSYLPNCKVYH